MHKYVWDKAVERALIRYVPNLPFGTTVASEEISEYIFTRWASRSVAGRATGIAVRTVGYGLGIWAIVDTFMFAHAVHGIYMQHHEQVYGDTPTQTLSQPFFS